MGLREEVQHQPEVRQGQVQVLREELRQGVQGARDPVPEESEEGQQGGEAQQMQTNRRLERDAEVRKEQDLQEVRRDVPRGIGSSRLLLLVEEVRAPVSVTGDA